MSAGTTGPAAVPAGTAALAGVAGFLAWVLALGPGPGPAALGVLGGAVWVLAVIDVRTRRVPNRAAAALTAALPVVLVVAENGEAGGAVRGVVVGVAAFAVFLVLHLLSGGELGMGDVKIAPVVFAPLGLLSVTTAALAFVAAFGALAVSGLLGRVGGRLDRGASLPFVPFLAAGALVALLVGAG